MKRLILFFVAIFSFQVLSAQDEAIFSHYYLNPVLVNPAATGFFDKHQFLLNARASWSGFPDAPQTYAAQYNGPVGNTFGFGIGVMQETAAQLERLKGRLGFAFRFNIGEYVKLSTGFSTEFQQMKLSSSVMQSNFFQLGDKVLENAMDGSVEFDAALGVYTTFNENTYVGLAFSNLVRARLDGIVTEADNGSLFQYYLFHVGHQIDIYDLNFTLEPSLMIRQVRNSPFQVDFNLKAGFLNDNLVTGFSYRSIGAVGVLLGTKLSSLQLYYSYDLSFQRFQKFNGGSHEVTVSFTLLPKQKNGY